MDLEFEHLLDQCLSQLNKGQALETVLGQYPAQADALRPALLGALAVQRTPQPIPSAQAREAGKARLLAAVTARQAQFEQVVDESLAAIRSGHADVETVLEQYPEFAPGLQPVLRTAHIVRSTPQPVPAVAARAAGKRELLVAVARKRQALSEPAGWRRTMNTIRDFIQGLGQPSLPLGRAAIAVLALVIFLTTTGYGVTQVAASSLPDSPLYPVKLATEDIQLALTPSLESRARLLLMFSERRLQEATLTASTGRGLNRALSEMVKNNDQAMRVIAQLPVDDRPPLFADLAGLAEKERKVLGQVKHVVPSSNLNALDDAIGRSAEAQAKAEEARKNPRRIELILTEPAPTMMLLPTETPTVVTLTPPPPEPPVENPARNLPSPTAEKPVLPSPTATLRPLLPTVTPTALEPTPLPTLTPTPRGDFNVDQPRPHQSPTPVPTAVTASTPQPTATAPIQVPTIGPPPSEPQATPTRSQ